MRRHLMCALVLFVYSINCFAQQTFKDERYGFSMEQPKNWLVGDQKLISENLDKIKFDDAALATLIKNNKGSYLLVSFYKYDVTKHAGVIPTIQVNVRNNPTQNFEQFHQTITKSTETLKSYFPDFAFVVKPDTTTINGAQSSYFVGSYTLNGKNGNTGRVRVTNFAFPHGKFFFQVSFIDELGSAEDESALFARIARSIKIGK